MDEIVWLFSLCSGEIWSPAPPLCHSSCDKELKAFNNRDHIPPHKKHMPRTVNRFEGWE